MSEQSQQAGESSSSRSTPPANKRRQSKDPPKSSKSAKFKDDIPNNEGKTASTKKHAKAKKKESYAKKASTEIKKSWIYDTIIYFDTKLGKCNKPCDVMYGRMAEVLRVFQFQELKSSRTELLPMQWYFMLHYACIQHLLLIFFTNKY